MNNIKTTYQTHDLNQFFVNHKDIDYSEYPNKDLYVISDFQNNIFNNINNQVNLDDWNIFLYDHNFKNFDLFLSDVRLLNEFLSIDELISINVTLNNISNIVLPGFDLNKRISPL